MGILMRILGVLWCLIGLLVTIGAVIGATSDAVIEPGMGIAYGVGAVIGASLVLSPVWLTGIVFFLLPGWVRKQPTQARSDVFS